MGKIILLAITGVLLVNTVKQIKSEFAVPLTVAVGISMLMLILNDGRELYQSVRDFLYTMPQTDNLYSDVFKIMVIGYLSKFTCNLCDDYGHKSISDKVDIASKIAVTYITFPWVQKLLVNINKLL